MTQRERQRHWTEWARRPRSEMAVLHARQVANDRVFSRAFAEVRQELSEAFARVLETSLTNQRGTFYRFDRSAGGYVAVAAEREE